MRDTPLFAYPESTMTKDAPTPPPETGPRHSAIVVTPDEREQINEIAATFLHAPTYVRDAALNMLKMLPHVDTHLRKAHLETLLEILTADGLSPEPDRLDERFIIGIHVTADYLNLDSEHLTALTRRGRNTTTLN